LAEIAHNHSGDDENERKTYKYNEQPNLKTEPPNFDPGVVNRTTSITKKST
jgi:hypothetical protein